MVTYGISTIKAEKHPQRIVKIQWENIYAQIPLQRLEFDK